MYRLNSKFKRYLLYFVILFAIGIILGFMEKLGWANGFNMAIEKFAVSHRSDALNGYFVNVSNYVDTIYDIVWGLIIVVILAVLKKWKEPLMLFLSLVFTGIFVEGLKELYKIPRPTISQLVHESSYSFPSGHSVGAFALYGMIIYFLWRSNLPKAVSRTLSVILGLFILSILYDRLYVGVHWPLDVIGGASIGLSCIFLAVGIVQNMKRNADN